MNKKLYSIAYMIALTASSGSIVLGADNLTRWEQTFADQIAASRIAMDSPLFTTPQERAIATIRLCAALNTAAGQANLATITTLVTAPENQELLSLETIHSVLIHSLICYGLQNDIERGYVEPTAPAMIDRLRAQNISTTARADFFLSLVAFIKTCHSDDFATQCVANVRTEFDQAHYGQGITYVSSQKILDLLDTAAGRVVSVDFTLEDGQQ